MAEGGLLERCLPLGKLEFVLGARDKDHGFYFVAELKELTYHK